MPKCLTTLIYSRKTMNKYLIYFEIFGKKMKTEIMARDREDAKRKMKEKIIFHKIEKISDPTVDYLKNIFRIKD